MYYCEGGTIGAKVVNQIKSYSLQKLFIIIFVTLILIGLKYKLQLLLSVDFAQTEADAPPGPYASYERLHFQAPHPVNDPVDWSFPNIKIFPYGTYMATLNVGRAASKDPSLCMEYYGQILPKT